MLERKVRSLDQYWKVMEGILWTRFEQVVKLHVKSIIDCNVHHLSSVDSRPHYVSFRLF